MPESKVKEVAQLFGLELEEEFLIKDSLHKYKFTEDGLMCFLNWEPNGSRMILTS